MPLSACEPAVRFTANQETQAMEDHVYKQIDVTGSSTVGTDDAISKAIKKAGESVKHMDWLQVTETRGYIERDAVKYWQVTVKIGFRIED
jgi:flavin-binding protein dodecin